ncbi:FKBP-type peptidyl-prolyl cis-trans isomerase [Thioalkalivibrio sp. XN8]|uniref:FKBP-type peptidyl-prolyl cis-trans isomerase n=1 Tax=Thioalkalivibrio sp. XN8 TaxID=2712863 RepID=UPI0013EC80EE|nr:FKBP-type peptidyl-prolyl cis-trans isomerase [Thioalkalivibrio sp. XN8]NGP52313.1 peptidylprolyl isomerase [Thioalkalivibrio sp. XN8]
MLSRLPAAAAAALFLVTGASLQAQEEVPVIKDGSTVSIEYTLKLDDGSTADTNVGAEPLTYVQGEQQILPALEAQLAGMTVDETRQVTLTAEEGYGPVREEGYQEVPLAMIPEDARNVGARLVGQNQQGQPIHAQVKELKDETVVLDLNHPLAGEQLHFDVKVLEIK